MDWHDRSACNQATLLALVFLSAAFPVQAATGAYFQTTGQQFVVGNPLIELTFNAGNGSLLNLVDKVTGRDLISRKVANYNGFFFRFTTPTNSTPQQGGGYVGRLQALTPVRVTTGIQITMKFGQFNVSGTTLNLTATLVITVDDSSPLTSWQLSINNPEQITIESVALPSIAGIGQLSDNPANDYLVFPSLSGVLFQDPAHNFALNRGYGGGGNYPNGYNNMQFLAYYSTESGAGVYLASEDSAGYTKTMNAGKLGTDWMNLAHAYVPPFRLATDMTVPYVVKLGVFHGDWYDAAMIYRNWALQQPWVQNGPLVANTDVPDWYKNTGMMGWKDTFAALGPGNSYASLAQAAAVWKQELQSLPVMDWIAWENQGPWVDDPDFLPPSQGWPAFDSAVSATHAAGGRLMVEPTTNVATVGAPSWSTLQATASQQADGSMYLNKITTLNQNYQSGTETNAQMDPTQPWHDALLSFTSQLAQHGIDLIHMDGNPFPYALCFAANHAHPPGGGNWWFQGLAQIYADVRKAGRAANPNFAMGGEWYAEPFLSLTDSGQDQTNILDPTIIGGSGIIDQTKVSYIPL
jgi:hypothetical protein